MALLKSHGSLIRLDCIIINNTILAIYRACNLHIDGK